MCNVNKNVFYSCLFLSLILIIFIFFRFAKYNGVTNSEIVVKQVNSYDIVKERYIYENSSRLSIGKNLKEIQNGYYDINIEFDNKRVIVFFNKLYKEEYSKEIYVDKNYLYEILTLINAKFDFNISDLKLQEMVILISEKYMEYKTTFSAPDKISGNINNNYAYEINFNEGVLILNIEIMNK